MQFSIKMGSKLPVDFCQVRLSCWFGVVGLGVPYNPIF